MDTSANGWRLPAEAEWLAAADDGHPQKVGTKAANAKGLYDMSGNVWEWCWDKSDFSSNRVLCGGAWSIVGSDVDHCKVSSRYYKKPDERGYYFGFRLVRSAQ